MQTSHCVSAVLGDDDGSLVLLVPAVEVIGQLHLYELRVTRVLVPAVITVNTDHINELRLSRMKGHIEMGG